MSEYACSICQTLLFRCTNYRQTPTKWALLICQPCAQNGKFKDYVKKTYQLSDNVVLKKEVNDKMKVSIQQSFEALIKPQTLQFGKRYLNYTQNIIKDQPDFVQTVKQCNTRIQDWTQGQTKKIIIDEVKGLNQKLTKQVEMNRINVKRVQELSREIRKRIGNLRSQPNDQIPDQREGKPIFEPQEINGVMSDFNKKSNQMNNKAMVLTKLVQEGDKILVQKKQIDK